jgi:PEP-CTERM motif
MVINCRALLAGTLAAAGVMAGGTATNAAVSDINGVFQLPRSPFNAYPNSNLTITDSLNATGTVSFDESNFGIPDAGAPNGLNRHNAFFSSDGGATPYDFMNQEGFSVSFDLNLDAVNDSPRKEAGLFTSSVLTGSGFFIVTTDTGEIATFSSYFPFTSNVSDDGSLEYGGTPYVPGTNVNIKMVYRPGVGSEATFDLVKPASLEFIVDGITSGVIALGNLENGIDDGTRLGLYLQSDVPFADAASESVSAAFTNINIATLLDGDLNADGFVGVDDLNIVLVNWNQSQVPEVSSIDDIRADPTNDNFVGVDDLNVVLVNWNAGTPPDVSAIIPEPASLTLMSLGAVAVLRRRK